MTPDGRVPAPAEGAEGPGGPKPGRDHVAKARLAAGAALLGAGLIPLFFYLRLYNPVYYLIVFGIGIFSFVLSNRALAEIKASQGKIKGLPLPVLGKTLAGLVTVISAWAMVADLGGFAKFQGRARQSEAKVNLSSIWTAHKEFLSRHQRPPAGFSELDWRPEAERRYSYFMGGDSVPATRGGPHRLPPEILAGLQNGDYVAAAAGNIDKDDGLDIWVIAEDKSLHNLSNDLHLP